MALELPSLLCTFENSTKSFDSDFFYRIAKRSINNISSVQRDERKLRIFVTE